MSAQKNWQAVNQNDSWQVQTEEGVVVAFVVSNKDAALNAKLIAASPYLLESFKAIVSLIGDNDLPDNGELSGAAICDMARSAISMIEDI